ncbi:hypothetical protein FHT80_005696 [Rhizobium sp. BK226]|uniref:hypothetical protein n=1 Tax=Rhizobium sp. BK226 TaxID=2587075 RepID=UPI00161274F6|nr:hypothetical protein [Rhizobium sp. BK226]MBB4116323.1 hypothetical protein [Rhizobium sp. BK226]
MQETDHRCGTRSSTAIFLFGFLILLRFLLSSRLPSYILADMPHDDGWVVTRAQNILSGNWLGMYDQYTLIKGVFSPLLLALSASIGVTFSGLNTAMYCLACAVFVVAVRPVVKNQWLQLLLFAVLLFNPISYALDTGQRVYRNGIGQWQILLIFGCLITMFLRRDENWKKQLRWAIAAGLTLGAFFETREDGTWIYPFVLGSLFLSIVFYLVDRRGPKKAAILFMIPLAIAWSLHGIVMLQNYARYGAPVVNDRGGGTYAKVAGDLHAIAPNADDEQRLRSGPYKERYYNIYVSTMEKALAASPTLNSAADPIRRAIAMWASWEEDNIGELSTDHMLFALRDGVKAAGYYRSLPETEAFYGKVHEELQAAFRNGTLVERGFAISPLIKRLQGADFVTALSILPMSIRNIAQFRDVSVKTAPSFGSEVSVKKVNLLAGGDYFLSGGMLNGSGWAFAEDAHFRVTAGLYDKGGILIAALPFRSGQDVYVGSGSKFENARMSRFEFSVEGYNLNSGVTMRFLDQSGNLLKEVPADPSMADGAKCGGADPGFHYCIDTLMSEAPSAQFFDEFVSRANRVIDVYKLLTPYFGILACLIYVVATVFVFWEIRHGVLTKTLPVWLVLTGVGFSFLVFMFSMCIITATSFNSMTYLYTAPAYVLLLMFSSISVCWAMGVITAYGKRGSA